MSVGAAPRRLGILLGAVAMPRDRPFPDPECVAPVNISAGRNGPVSLSPRLGRACMSAHVMWHPRASGSPNSGIVEPRLLKWPRRRRSVRYVTGQTIDMYVEIVSRTDLVRRMAEFELERNRRVRI